MAETMEPSRWHRLRHTPLRDVVFGRVTGRLDVRPLLATSELSPAVRALIERVVRRTRLWRLEKVDVARELVAHFLDGVEAGHTSDEMIASFGDEHQAAKLIRRAKKRQRPIAWHVWRCGFWCAVTVLAFYVGVAIVFYSGSPTIRVNYVERMNQRLLAARESERAWPVYREALVKLGEDPVKRWPSAKPGDPEWAELTAFARQHRASLDLARRAAALPALGFPAGLGIREEDRIVFTDTEYVAEAPAFTTEGPLMGVLLPHLSKLRQLGRLIYADALASAEEGDGAVVLAAVETLDAMADQVAQENLMISQLVALSIRGMGLDLVDRVLADHPSLWSDDALKKVAHRLAKIHTAADVLSMNGERDFMHDVAQRVFTDDGQGDGRLTSEGLRFYNEALSTPQAPEFYEANFWLLPAAQHMAQPAMLFVSASRKEMLDKYDAMMDRMQAELAVPIWEIDRAWQRDELETLMASPVGRYRYWLIATLTPAFEAARAAPERYLGRRDGVLVAIALELHRRRHGAYPATLQDLVPSLLPEVPRDRITGEAVRYRVDEGVPVVYSVGADRDDDGGVMVVEDDGDAAPHLAARWDVPVDRAHDGDWVLWPQGGER